MNMAERGTIDAVFILRRMKEDYHAKGKMLYLRLEDDTVPRKVLEWAMRKKVVL